jgi:hypothetical protein
MPFLTGCRHAHSGRMGYLLVLREPAEMRRNAAIQTATAIAARVKLSKIILNHLWYYGVCLSHSKVHDNSHSWEPDQGGFMLFRLPDVPDAVSIRSCAP